MRVCVLGCGDVGTLLGRRLLDDAHHVVGVRRSTEGLAAVEAAGLEAVRADVTDPEALAAVPDADAVVFAASAGGRDAAAARAVYVDGLSTVVDHFGARPDPPDRLVYTSSTGVYGDHGGAWVDEETPLDPGDDRTAALLDAERVVLEDAPAVGIDPTVARFGGIYGPDRFRLERYLEGPVPTGYLNLVHREDAAGILRFLLERDLARGEVVVGVDDEPVARPELSAWLAEQLGRDPPAVREPSAGTDSERARADKRCSNGKLRSLGYEFAYPTYRDGLQEVLAAADG